MIPDQYVPQPEDRQPQNSVPLESFQPVQPVSSRIRSKKLALTSGLVVFLLLTTGTAAFFYSQGDSKEKSDPALYEEQASTTPAQTPAAADSQIAPDQAMDHANHHSSNTVGTASPPAPQASPTPAQTPSPNPPPATPPAPAPAPPPTPPPPQTKSFTINSFSYGYSPSFITVSPGDVVTITLTNSGGKHDLVIDELGVGTSSINAGQTTSVTFSIPQSAAGQSYAYYCSIGSHRAQGMEGTIQVTN